jgi:prepilin peptidase CpaA
MRAIEPDRLSIASGRSDFLMALEILLFGGVLSFLLLQFRLLPLPPLLAEQKWIMQLHEKGGGVPYGIALAAAALMVYPQTGWMTKIVA